MFTSPPTPFGARVAVIIYSSVSSYSWSSRSRRSYHSFFYHTIHGYRTYGLHYHWSGHGPLPNRKSTSVGRTESLQTRGSRGGGAGDAGDGVMRMVGTPSGTAGGSWGRPPSASRSSRRPEGRPNVVTVTRGCRDPLRPQNSVNSARVSSG